MKPFIYFLPLFIATLVLECDAYIKCFVCQSINDNRCSDYFQIQEYDALDCKGTCIKRRGRRGGGVEITRECVIQTKERCYDTTYEGITVKACTCNQDYCNTAELIGVKFPVLFITVITSLIMYCTL